ncbi:MAG: type II toxin-antitoxin system VapB family antitoxin [Ignavibacteria bacterium]|nr:type II toxin-antitoxin system VapB family antitoxin [Ignavibacteria bacterium]
MRTTSNSSDILIKQLKNATGVKNRTKIINMALEEYLRKIKRQNIIGLYGKIKIDKKVLKMREI